MGKHVMMVGMDRRRTAWIAAAVVGGLVLAGVLGWRIHTGQGGFDHTAPAHTTEEGTGVVDGDGPVMVEVWLDVSCGRSGNISDQRGHASDPSGCGELAAVSAALDQLVAEELVTRIYHPVSLGEDSVRVAASVACAADHEAHPRYLAALLAAPPAANGAARIDDELIHRAGTAGIIDPTFARCVRGERYQGWARQVTAAAAASRVASLPMVRVDRAEVEALPAAVASAVAAAAKDSRNR